MEFEWNPGKAAANERKHEVSFDEAMTVFADWQSLTIPDPAHSEEEDRFIILGASSWARVLVVSHTHRAQNVRIISARRANARERRLYAS